MRLYPLRLWESNTSVDFMRMSKINYAISIILSVISIACVAIFGFNFGIDFAGGVNLELRTKDAPDVAKMRETLTHLDIGEVMIQTFGTENDVSIRVGNHSGDSDLNKKVEVIKSELNKHFGDNIEYRKVDFVGPQVGWHLIKSGIYAVCFSFLAIMIYVWIRFEWQFGVGVLIALVHDCIIALGVMSVTRLDFNLSTVAAVLTIIGYSVNDSVVIYDRIRENLRKYATRGVDSIINISINETLSRTTLTVVTTLLADLALIIFGGEALRSFSILVFVGIVCGTYSSIFISAPILKILKLEQLTGTAKG
ncbi:MAG: preprotein translocase subunit SecF [Pseudomonadota bacterium]|jgi:preprotein translocase subunit SecF